MGYLRRRQSHCTYARVNPDALNPNPDPPSPTPHVHTGDVHEAQEGADEDGDGALRAVGLSGRAHNLQQQQQYSL